MPGEIFVRCCPDSALRMHLAAAVIIRCQWYGARVIVIRVGGSWSLDGVLPGGAVTLPRDDFWRTSRQLADELSTGPYVLIDDDHLPIGRNWYNDGMHALAAHPDWVMLSSWSINGEVPRGDVGDERPPVFPIHSAGTPCFVRKGTFVDLPDGPMNSYDLTLSDWLRAKGNIGFIENVRHNHLGCGYSQVDPAHWGA